MKKEETKFKERVLKQLRNLEGIWCEKIQQVSIHGTPDILICAKGKFIALELKTDVGVLSALQEWNLQEIQKAGGVSIVSSPSTWPQDFERIKSLLDT